MRFHLFKPLTTELVRSVSIRRLVSLKVSGSCCRRTSDPVRLVPAAALHRHLPAGPAAEQEEIQSGGSGITPRSARRFPLWVMCLLSCWVLVRVPLTIWVLVRVPLTGFCGPLVFTCSQAPLTTCVIWLLPKLGRFGSIDSRSSVKPSFLC